MKLKNIFFLLLCMTCSLGFVSCDDDDDPAPTHTDASCLVEGTFMGNLVDEKGVEKATDVVITLTRVDDETIQAVDLRCQSTTLKMNQTIRLNVAKAGENRYMLSSGAASVTTKCSAVIDNDVIVFYATMTSSYVIKSTAAAKMKTMTCTKVTE